jgi:hypothetical protein
MRPALYKWMLLSSFCQDKRLVSLMANPIAFRLLYFNTFFNKSY